MQSKSFELIEQGVEWGVKPSKAAGRWQMPKGPGWYLLHELDNDLVQATFPDAMAHRREG
jgi:hypothetical protein